jgi:hypothetical protein
MGLVSLSRPRRRRPSRLRPGDRATRLPLFLLSGRLAPRLVEAVLQHMLRVARIPAVRRQRLQIRLARDQARHHVPKIRPRLQPMTLGSRQDREQLPPPAVPPRHSPGTSSFFVQWPGVATSTPRQFFSQLRVRKITLESYLLVRAPVLWSRRDAAEHPTHVPDRGPGGPLVGSTRSSLFMASRYSGNRAMILCAQSSAPRPRGCRASCQRCVRSCRTHRRDGQRQVPYSPPSLRHRARRRRTAVLIRAV